ncbi:MAG: hypothetical protein KAQ93_05200 [Spirochaetales bacterium]|nr:hypothetical protein [Spirochaetales bacterium]
MKKSIIVFVLLLMGIFVIFADGAGGFYSGYQVSSLPFMEENDFETNNMGLYYSGGFGYGVSWNNVISGGFGYAIYASEDDSKPIGGFGGVINGIRLLRYPFNVSLMSWTGFGGITSNTIDGKKSSFAISEELTVELGFPLFRWFSPTIYAGYQVIGSLGSGEPFEDFLSYTPVLGFRFQWGKFY